MNKAKVGTRGKQVANALADLMNAYAIAAQGIEKRKLAVEITRTFDVLSTSTGDQFSSSILKRIATHYSQKALL